MSIRAYFIALVAVAVNLLIILTEGFAAGFLGQLMVFVVLTIASLILLYALYNQKPSSVYGPLVFIAFIVNSIYIRSIMEPTINGLLAVYIGILMSVLGYLTLFARMRSPLTQDEKEHIIETKIIPKLEALKKQMGTEPWPGVVEIIYPGKYVAAKGKRVYHLPTCATAQKIPEKQRVWLK